MKFWRILSIAVLTALCACTRGEMGYSYTDTSVEQGKVTILYAPGASNISSFIAKNIVSITKGALPYGSSRKTMLVYAHLDEGESYLRRVSSDEYGKTVEDTLLTIAAGLSASNPAVISEVLGKVAELYPPENNSYTLILSSHGTGWLPTGAVEPDYGKSISWDYAPKKSFGSEKIDGVVYDISIHDLAEAIPMKLDCLIFDACLMGCVEVAYEFKDKVIKMCCSPAEVPGNGYVYTNLGEDLLSDSATPESFGKAFFEHYRTALETGVPGEDSFYGVTSTTVDCTKMEPLAQLCKTLFQKYRSAIAALDYNTVQRYYRIDSSVNYYRDFFDLEDILLKAGITSEEHSQLEQALAQCITYKDATSHFMKNYGGFEINVYSGLSMYLPCKGNADLDAFYKTLEWNKATKLVE